MVSAIFFVFYYGVFYPTVPVASLEHTGMYDYNVEENPILKRDVSHETNELDHGEYYYDAVEDVDDLLRNKRKSTEETSSSSPASMTGQPTGESSSNGLPGPHPAGDHDVPPTHSKPTTKGGSKWHHTTPTTTTEFVVEYDPDIHLSNSFVDSVFAHSDRTNMSLALGLCRKNADVKIPQFQENLFPKEEANGILSCINDILHNQTRKQICVQLDAEMNAYLRWLIITGESKEKHKPVKLGVKDDFLFPSTPCAGAPPLNAPQCLVQHGFEDSAEE